LRRLCRVCADAWRQTAAGQSKGRFPFVVPALAGYSRPPEGGTTKAAHRLPDLSWAPVIGGQPRCRLPFLPVLYYLLISPLYKSPRCRCGRKNGARHFTDLSDHKKPGPVLVERGKKAMGCRYPPMPIDTRRYPSTGVG
jgi:hypothetical protein